MVSKFSRRDFIKLGAAGLGAVLLTPKFNASAYLPDFPIGDRLGRVFSKTEIRLKPDIDSPSVETLYDDNLIVILQDVLGTSDSRIFKSRLWYETDKGYVYAPDVQPVKLELNQPVATLPTYGAMSGFWAEVTVPYVDIKLDGDTPRSPRLQETLHPRFYYSQVIWVDNVTTNENGEIIYHLSEKHGSYGDEFWADGRAFKILTPEDLSPIHPDVTDKRIVVDLSHQTVSCYEGKDEILYTLVSTGAKYNIYGEVVDNWATPIGENHVVNRKFVSLHMAGGDSKASGYEEFAVSYSSIFASGGVAFHSTYWHNSWGDPMSHGCVNLKPEDAKFIYRWTLPNVPYEDGKIEQQGYDGTKVRVFEI